MMSLRRIGAGAARALHSAAAPAKAAPAAGAAAAAAGQIGVAAAEGGGLVRMVAGLAGGSAAFAGLYAATDEGLSRSMNFWSQAFPVFLHYKATEFAVKDLDDAAQDERYEPLHQMYAPKVERLCLSLRGFYLKSAQFVAIMDDFLPKQYMEFCKRMQDQVPSEMTSAQVRDIVETGIGRPLAEVFREWEDAPFGAASIGQVHRATLHDGRVVIVKVMYPGVEKMFRGDMKTLQDFCRLAQPQHLPALNEIEKQFMTEFDYRAEAENLDKVWRNIMPRWGKRVAVPAPMKELCSKHVLVMEYLPGQKLVDGVRAYYSRVAKRMGTSLEELERKQREQIKAGKISPKSLATEAALTRLQSAVLASGDFCANVPRVLYNYTMGLALGRCGYVRGERPLNLGVLLELLLKVHADEVFVDGVFNGDPHPGNILLMDDGRLGLIDYGQVKELDLDTRISLAQLYIALEKDDRETIVNLAKSPACGLVTKYMNPDFIYKYVCFYHDRDTPDVTEGLNVQQFSEYLDANDPIVKINDDVVMVSRSSILLRGMANAFQFKLATSKYWAPVAREWLKSIGAPEKPEV